ncbi:MAG: ShlB/FhaC/HecB family hemolysin secretion/activation protein [Leptothrix ochracea]|uniref:ShlB/FhaC/HecB family hemolysin secretion/activation protein n=1 Tax=Leptothrix ochracea TaxID=735331 RepID=UPI0034E259CD
MKQVNAGLPPSLEAHRIYAHRLAVKKHCRATLVLFILLRSSIAQSADFSSIDIQRRQAIQLEQSQIKSPERSENLRSSPIFGVPEQVIVSEPECFQIQAFVWQGAESFDWLTAESTHFTGKCLGAQSLVRLRDYLTLALLGHGYVTSRVIYPEQNLRQGTLTIQIIPGLISSIKNNGTPIGKTWFPLAINSGEILNQRDLDQSLDNFRRLTSQTGTNFDILPGTELGDSSIVIVNPKSRLWQGVIGIDNSGGESTGKYQLFANLSIDSIFGIYDNLALTYNSNANYYNQATGNHTSSLQWSFPLGYTLISLGINQSDYKHTVAGFVAPIEYTGINATSDLGLSYTTYRANNYKGQSQIKIFRKTSQNSIDSINIDVQARDVLGWEINHQHKQQIHSWSTTMNLAIRGSLPKQSNNIGILVGMPDWDGHYHTTNINFNAAHEFIFPNGNLHYETQIRWQDSANSLPPSEYLSIGGRYSVRGFDSEATLSSESGGYWRNEIGLSLFDTHTSYFSFDIGKIAEQQSNSNTISGFSMGERGSFFNLSYDISIGWPIVKPDYFTKHPTIAGTLSIQI